MSADHNGLRHLFAQRPDLVAGDAAVLGEPTVPLSKWDARAPCAVRVELLGVRAHGTWMGRNVVHAGRCLRPLDDYVARQPMIDGCTYHEALQAVFVEGAWRATSCRTGPS